MASNTPLLPSQRIVQISLLIVTAISLFGGVLQMYLGQPETTPRLDNIHRFLGGVYLGSGLLGLWAALTIRQHNMLVFLLALTVFLGGIGRLVSISIVGVPQPAVLWFAYLIPELALPWVIAVAQLATNRQLGANKG